MMLNLQPINFRLLIYYFSGSSKYSSSKASSSSLVPSTSFATKAAPTSMSKSNNSTTPQSHTKMRIEQALREKEEKLLLIKSKLKGLSIFPF